MTNLIVEVSKYLMILLMAVYTYGQLPVLFPKGYGPEAAGVRRAEPGHVRHSFPGLCGYVPEDGK